jgi:hypothetical protein
MDKKQLLISCSTNKNINLKVRKLLFFICFIYCAVSSQLLTAQLSYTLGEWKVGFQIKGVVITSYDVIAMKVIDTIALIPIKDITSFDFNPKNKNEIYLLSIKSDLYKFDLTTKILTPIGSTVDLTNIPITQFNVLTQHDMHFLNDSIIFFTGTIWGYYNVNDKSINQVRILYDTRIDGLAWVARVGTFFNSKYYFWSYSNRLLKARDINNIKTDSLISRYYFPINKENGFQPLFYQHDCDSTELLLLHKGKLYRPNQADSSLILLKTGDYSGELDLKYSPRWSDQDCIKMIDLDKTVGQIQDTSLNYIQKELCYDEKIKISNNVLVRYNEIGNPFDSVIVELSTGSLQEKLIIENLVNIDVSYLSSNKILLKRKVNTKKIDWKNTISSIYFVKNGDKSGGMREIKITPFSLGSPGPKAKAIIYFKPILPNSGSDSIIKICVANDKWDLKKTLTKSANINGKFYDITSNQFLDSLQLISKKNYKLAYITEQNNCFDTVFIKVNIDEPSKIKLDKDPVICGDNEAILDIVSKHDSIFIDGKISQVPIKIKNSGIYTLKCVDQNGCIDSLKLDVPFHENPTTKTEALQTDYFENGLRMPIQYSNNVVSYKWSPFTSLSCDNCPFPIFTSGTKTLYTISIKSDKGCSVKDSIYIDLKENLYILPNVISTSAKNPENKSFYLKGFGNILYDLEIYDKWGNSIFQSKSCILNDSNCGWTPNSNIFGTMTYVLKVKDNKGTMKIGTVTVL